MMRWKPSRKLLCDMGVGMVSECKCDRQERDYIDSERFTVLSEREEIELYRIRKEVGEE